MTKSKGFTLIELLVVIAIVAVLAVVVILTLNPAELLRQARDSNRISDASTIKNAMGLYLADQTSPVIGTVTDVGSALVFVSANSAANPMQGSASGWTASSGRALASTTMRNVDGTGWIPVNFSGMSSKSPITSLPVDPVNNTTYYYAYVATGSATVAPTYKFMVKAVESVKYSNGQAGDVVSTDGGNASTSIEVGSNMAL